MRSQTETKTEAKEMEAVYCRKSNLIATISPPHHLPPIAPIAGVTTSVTGQRRATNPRPNRSKYEWQ
nr:hypothetical protein Iba_chr11eCG12490 [Ipomoea batatas]GMD80082.1 hypothetical protein Iba_chr13dCG10220 [Ipomoea batatas]GMD92578.1 hypothetical protein Iba_chr14eCG10490 [Ipomoea batatas]